MKNIYTSIIKSIIKKHLLLITILFFNVPFFAQETFQNTSVNEKVLWANEPFGQYDMTKEVLDKRTETSKVFEKGNGAFIGHISNAPIHYQENGEWKTIYSSIIPNNTGLYNQYTYANTTNSIKSFYSNDINNLGTITVFPSGEALNDMKNMKMYYQKNGQILLAKQNFGNSNPIVNNKEITYSSIYGNDIDLRLTQSNLKRKMDYIINSSNALTNIPNGATHLVFEETVKLPAGWNVVNHDNTILIYNASQQVMATYQKPEFYDQNPDQTLKTDDSGNNKYYPRTDGDYEIVQNGQNLIIKTLVDLTWLTHSQRNFPVVIDPSTIYVTPIMQGSGYIDADPYYNGTFLVYTDGTGYVGGHAWGCDLYYATFMRFDCSSITAGSTINDVDFDLYQNYDYAARLSVNINSLGSANDPTLMVMGQNVLDALEDGTTMISVAHNSGTYAQMDQSTGWKKYDLGSTGDSEVEASLLGMLSQHFSIGLETWYYRYCDDYSGFDGYLDGSPPFITVDYTEPVADFTWIGGGDPGNWDDIGNWDTGTAPTSSDNCIIPFGVPQPNLILPGTYDCADLTINAKAVLEIQDGVTLNVAGNLSAGGNVTTNGSSKLDVTGTADFSVVTINAGSEVEVDGASTFTQGAPELFILDGTFDANGAFDASGITIDMDGASMLTLASTVTSLGSLDDAAGTVTYDGGTAMATGTYFNLVISSGNTHAAGGTITVNNDLTVSSGTFGVGSNTATVTGASDIDGTLTISTGTFDANGTFDAAGGVIDFTSSGTLILSSTVTSLGGLDVSNGTVNYDGGTSLFTDTYNNLTISSGNTHTATGNITVNNNLTVSSGTLGTSNKNITVDGTSDIDGTLSISTGTYNADGNFDATNGTIDFTGAGNLVLSSTVTDLGTLSATTGTVTYDGSSSQTVDNVTNYYNLSIEGASTKTAGGNLDVDGDLTTANTASCVLDLAAYDLSVAGDLTVGYRGGLDASDASCAVTFDGSTSTVDHAGSNSESVGETILNDSYSNLSNWTETHVDGNASWSVGDGSAYFSAYSGSTCAWIQEDDYDGSSDYITFDLPAYSNMNITYMFIKPTWSGDADYLWVEYYNGSSWVELASYTTTDYPSWTSGNHDIPDGATKVRFYSSLYYGYGIGVDDVLITGDALTEINPTFKDVTINGAEVTLADKMDITGTLTLTSGDIISDATNKLTIKDGGTVSGASASSHVVGPMDIETSTTGDYDVPIGDGTRYRPLIITPEEAVATSYTAEFKPTAPSSTDCGTGVDHVAPGSWWDVDRGAEDVDCYMTIAWDATSGVDAYQDLLLTHYSSATSKWENKPGTIVGNNTAGTIKTNDPFNDFSPFNLGSSGGGNSLPIDLLSFTADCSHDLVDVNFTVVSQVNNDYFMIERSEDAINWEEIAILDGAGTNNTQMDYSFVDTDPLSGLAYYRLTQVDFNEKGKTFSPVSASCQGTTTSMPMDVYPNPAIDHFTMEIDLEAYQGNDVYYTLLDATGAIVQQQHIDLDKGTNKQVFDVRELPKGVYFLRFINTKDHISEKRIVIK